MQAALSEIESAVAQEATVQADTPKPSASSTEWDWTKTYTKWDNWVVCVLVLVLEYCLMIVTGCRN